MVRSRLKKVTCQPESPTDASDNNATPRSGNSKDSEGGRCERLTPRKMVFKRLNDDTVKLIMILQKIYWYV